MSFSDKFDHIIVTAPNEKISNDYNIQLQRLQSNYFPFTTFDCVFDPDGMRIGSGGGTLNALDYLSHKYTREKLLQSKVLIVHSGGDSRRSPFHSVCGKAWATINTNAYNNTYMTPLLLLINELQEFCRNCLNCSVVIASSDVILDITSFNEEINFPTNCFTIVSVPEVITTAKNHGVIVYNNNNLNESADITIGIANNYLQKPSIDELRKQSAVFIKSDIEYALIDTGIVIAQGKSFENLLNLLEDNDISRCTAQRRLYQITDHNINRNDITSQLRLELYSDILLSLTITNQNSSSFSSYLSRLNIKLSIDSTINDSDLTIQTFYKESNNIYNRSLFKLWDVFNLTPLYTIVVYTGMFYHLGTTSEYLQLITYQSDSKYDSKIYKLYNKHKLSNKINSISTLTSNTTITNSLLYSNTSTNCSSSSYIEFSCLSGEYIIGHNSYTSHVDSYHGKDLIVNDNIMIQQVHLSTDIIVFITLSVYDDIKLSFTHKNSTICGASWKHLFEISQSTVSDIWPDITDSTDQCIWNAKLFPAKSTNEPFTLTFTWLQHLTNLSYPLTNEYIVAITDWIKSDRLSLLDILNRSNAGLMYEWRLYLVYFLSTPQLSYYLTISDIDSYNKMYIDVIKCVDMIINIVNVDKNEALAVVYCLLTHLILIPNSFDLLYININKYIESTGRQLQLPNDFINKLINILTVDLSDHYKQCQYNYILNCLTNQKKELVERWIVDTIIVLLSNHKIARCYLLIGQLYKLSNYEINEFEHKAQYITSNDIQSSLSEYLTNLSLSINVINYNRIVVAEGPVRIDLAGGWSDTPPICYDLGGSVLNVAIKIDNKNPIRCVCRFLPNNPIIILKSLKLINNQIEGSNNNHVITDTAVCTSDSDFANVSDLSDPCSLLKALVIALDIIKVNNADSSYPLQDRLAAKLSGGIEIACISYLPIGSGMGGSSILAAVAIKSLSTLLNISLTNEAISYLVCYMEQLMTSGGGWQDQIGGIYSGFKISHSINCLPLRLSIDSINVTSDVITAFEERTFLIYTGQQRLAKNTLINALRRYSTISSEDNIINQLKLGAVNGAKILISNINIDANQIVDQISDTLNDYWRLKKLIAEGSEPSHISKFLSYLHPICRGQSLCGAGGGGFAVVILDSRYSYNDLNKLVDEARNIIADVSLHRVTIDNDGIITKDFQSYDERIDITSFLEY